MKKYHYNTCCVDSTAELINAMADIAKEVSYKTFSRNCEGLQEWEKSAGYTVGHERGGLRMKDDYAVSFYKSSFDGKPCFYICHSAIEYIWIMEV